MCGIRGLDSVGAAHAAFGLAALALGPGVVLLPKGTALHRRIGLLYALMLLLLNGTALAIYDLWMEIHAQVLRLAGEGRNGPDIAAELRLSEGTVRNYLSDAIGKVGGRNRVEAARIARQKGWL